MRVVVATSEATMADARVALGRRAGEIEVVDVGEGRLLVSAQLDDATEAWRLASRLREEGLAAVSRPEGGAALERWQRDTDPLTLGDAVTVVHACASHPRGGLPGLVELGFGGFGNGRHPTTSLLVEELAARLAGGERVLDVGCGSGVLGLSAIRLGAGSAVATDVQPAAVEATRANAALNAMSGQVEATCAPVEDIEATFDVVVANLGRAAIVELAIPLMSRVAAGGWLAVSGISPAQGDLVAGYLRSLRETERRSDRGWAVIVFDCRSAEVRPWPRDGHGAAVAAVRH